MPILSHARHGLRFTPDPDEAKHLNDVEALLKALQRMDVNPRVQKMMLDRTVWLVVELTGNFYSRHRSLGAISSPGLRIQRDHVHTRKSLVAELQAGNQNLRSIIDRAQCCIVTKEEHVRLSKVPRAIEGWDRYRAADPPVKVKNMETGASVV